jgi:hypothetical protein
MESAPPLDGGPFIVLPPLPPPVPLAPGPSKGDVSPEQLAIVASPKSAPLPRTARTHVEECRRFIVWLVRPPFARQLARMQNASTPLACRAGREMAVS